MDKLLASRHGVQNKPSNLRNPGSFGMAAKHGESAPILKRSYPTPAVLIVAQESAVAAGKRKRNKLGYHRTSIACRHCRRRKIRCIESPEIQNRCVNCIRLKKDCSFCPVDQQAMVDSQGKPAGQGTSSSTSHSQSSSLALAPGQRVGMASRSAYGTGPMQGSIGHAAPAIVPSSNEYPSVTGEGLSMPNPSEQNLSFLPETSLAWGSAEPSPVTLTGSMDIGYGWRLYGSESGSTEQISHFAPVPTNSPTWVTTMPRTSQLSDLNWNSGIPLTAQARSMSFSGEVLSHPEHQFVPNPSNSPYNGEVSNMRNAFTSPMNQTSGPGHLSRETGDSSGGWQAQQQQMLRQQHFLQQNIRHYLPENWRKDWVDPAKDLVETLWAEYRPIESSLSFSHAVLPATNEFLDMED